MVINKIKSRYQFLRQLFKFPPLWLLTLIGGLIGSYDTYGAQIINGLFKINLPTVSELLNQLGLNWSGWVWLTIFFGDIHIFAFRECISNV
jgi:hypothetical protein